MRKNVIPHTAQCGDCSIRPAGEGRFACFLESHPQKWVDSSGPAYDAKDPSASVSILSPRAARRERESNKNEERRAACFVGWA